MAALLDEVPSRVLAVYAHPNDSDVACAGTLARWSAAGSAIALVICTRGDKGTTDPATDPHELAETRRAEVADAAKVIGIETHTVLDNPDGEVDNTSELRAELVAWARRWKPEVVIGHDPTAVFFGEGYVNHRDHRAVGWALVDAVAPAAASPLYFADAGPAHQIRTLLLTGTLSPDVVVDIGHHADQKAEALRCHASQLGSERSFVDDFVKHRAAEAGAMVGIAAGEGFRQVRLG